MIKGRPILSKEIIYSKISSEDIFREYCSPFKNIGEHFNSELRNDSKPSCIIDWIRGDLMYSDFGDGTHIRAIEYVKLKFSISYWQALEKIYNEFKLKENDNYLLGSAYSNSSMGDSRTFSDDRSNIKYNKSHKTIIKIKKRNWSEQDAKYWQGRYGINRSTLIKFRVIPISHFWIDSNKLNNQMFIADSLAYSYDFYWENGIFRRKIYQPLSKNRFWSNGGKISQGEGMLPYSGDLLVITKSLKDVMCYYELGITAIASVSESSFLPKEYIEKQKSRFNRIILHFDSDLIGIKKSKEFSEKWNIPYILIPEIYKSKDLSDLIYNHGKEKAKQIIKNLLYETIL